MAKAVKVHNAMVPKTQRKRVVTYEDVVVHDRQTVINLQLTEGEADCLMAVLGEVGGSKNSPRKYADRILAALHEATGIFDYDELDATPLLHYRINGIKCAASANTDLRFDDYPDPKAGRHVKPETERALDTLKRRLANGGKS